MPKTRHVYCPLHEETQCGYWVTFGGYLAPFIKAFKTHIKKDHKPASLAREPGGVIDNWIGDLIVKAGGREREEKKENRGDPS